MGLRFQQLAWAMGLKSLVVLPLALALMLALSGFVWSQTDVKLIVDDQCSYVKSRAASVGELLKENGVKVTANDLVEPGLSTIVRDGLTVRVKHSVPVAVKVDGQTKKLISASATVGELLQQAGIKFNRNDLIKPAVSTRLKKDMEITVVRLSKQVEAIQSPIPFQIVEEVDGDLPQGFRQVIITGQAGISLQMFEVIKADGREKSRQLKCERVLIDPVNEIVRVGTKPLKARQLAMAVEPGAVSRGTYRTIVMIATAYTPGHDCGKYTASGIPAKRGVVAVDPRIIPLGTRLYIEGYGEAVAADTGGKIKGNRIDLCFDTLEEAKSFGRRSVVVQILP